MEDSERISELAHALQYGTSEEAEDAIRELFDLKEQGRIKPHEMPEKLIENRQMRDRIEAKRENELLHEMMGDDPYGDMEPPPKNVDGIYIEYGVSERQQILRPALKAYPDIVNTLHKREAMAERVDAMVEAGEGSYDDENTYLEAAKWVHEWGTKLDRVEGAEERQKDFKQYREARGQSTEGKGDEE